MTRIQSHLALVLLPAALASCRDNLFCVDDLAPGIVVSVHDAVTDASIAPLARGEIRSGTFSDSLVAYTVDAEGVVISLTAGRGRSGTYQVRIEAEGYHPWIRTVVVGQYECGAVTANVLAELVPVE